MTTSHLKISLIDQAGDYESVNIDIKEIKVHSSSIINEDEVENQEDDAENDSDSGGWVTLEGSNIGVVNILDYTDGHELTIYDSEFPAGYISQIRLVLGNSNTVVIDGDSLDLKTPSGQQSGVKLKVNENLEAGLSYYLKLDFEAARSIVHTGSDKYLLKPVIRVFTENNGGSIKGEVVPVEETVSIYVLNDMDTAGSTIAGAGSSSFLISGIEPGTYSVSFEPDDDPEEGSLLSPKIVEDVIVEDQKITDMGIIDLNQE